MHNVGRDIHTLNVFNSKVNWKRRSCAVMYSSMVIRSFQLSRRKALFRKFSKLKVGPKNSSSPDHFAVAYLPYATAVCGESTLVSAICACGLVLTPSFFRTRKEVGMEICEALSFYHSGVKYVTLLSNSTRCHFTRHVRPIQMVYEKIT